MLIFDTNIIIMTITSIVFFIENDYSFQLLNTVQVNITHNHSNSEWNGVMNISKKIHKNTFSSLISG
jgi:hypothetical protein